MFFGKIRVAFIIIFSLSTASCKKDIKSTDLPSELINTNSFIKEIIEEINSNYASEIDRKKLEIGAINGMLSVLDEHSIYIKQEDILAFSQFARGNYLGIGIEFQSIGDSFEITSIIDDSPAQKAGLKIKDKIIAIDGNETKNMSIGDVVSNITSFRHIVKFSILRDQSETIDVSIKKNIIKLKSIKLTFIDNIALLKINYFNENTLTEVLDAIKKINTKQSSGLILDLRNNPGGIIDQAIGVADLFLANKKIVEIKSKNSDESRVAFSDGNDLFVGKQIVVLTNDQTASGAELLASALGENKRAIILGTRTFGKGSLQSIIPIPGRGAIKLTTAILLSPNGNLISKNGITPDIEIQTNKTESSDNDISIIQRAIDLIHGLSVVGSARKSND